MMRRLAFLLPAVLLLAGSALAADPIRAGYEQFYRGDFEGAYVRFRALAEREPENLAAAYGAIVALVERDLPDEELDREFNQRVERLLKLAEARRKQSPRDPEAFFYLAQGYGERSAYRFGNNSLWGAARDAAKAKKFSEELVKLQPDRADNYLFLGMYNYYVDIAPTFIKLLRIFLFLPGGNRALGLEQIERAARDGDLFRPRAELALANVYGWLESRPRDALEILERLHGRYPDNPEVSLDIARLYTSPGLELHERAAREYAEAVRRAEGGHPHYKGSVGYVARLGLARARQQQWRVEEAIAALTVTIDAAPEAPAWVLPRFLYTRANFRGLLNDPGARDDVERLLAEKKWKRWHKAARSLSKWMEERERSGDAALYATLIPGNRLVEEKKWAQAERFYVEMAEKHPGDWQVNYRRAYLEFARGNLEAAERGFQEITSANPGKMPDWLKANAWLYLARSRDLQGEREEAKRLYKKVVDDFEDDSAAGAARLGLVTPYRRSQ